MVARWTTMLVVDTGHSQRGGWHTCIVTPQKHYLIVYSDVTKNACILGAGAFGRLSQSKKCCFMAAPSISLTPGSAGGEKSEHLHRRGNFANHKLISQMSPDLAVPFQPLLCHYIILRYCTYCYQITWTEYAENALSLLSKTVSSIFACAINKRSNGSL